MKILEEVNISLEVILLLAVGVIMLVLGAVLFPVSAGALPYYEDGLYGLLLIMFGLQIQTVGKTPVGFVKRSWPILVPGIIIAVIGFVTCFIPGIFGDIPKYLVFVIFGVGGILLVLQMFFGKEMYQVWKTRGGGIFTHLSVSAASVYFLEILIAIFIAVQIFQPRLLPTILLAVVALLYGISLFYLALVLQSVYRFHPESDVSMRTSGTALGTVMGMQFGLFQMVVGCLLVPVNLGLLPFAVSAQQGTMMVLLGVQALVIGAIMTFAFTRNWIVFLSGMVFVAVGAFAIMVPDTIVGFLVILIGAFNIIGGLYLFYSLYGPKPKPGGPAPKPEGKVLRLARLIQALTLLTVILMIIFGVSVFIQNLIPGIIIGIILACFGLSQFVMLYVQSLAGKMQLAAGDIS